ncbi:hypothetical protein C7999DRAFT_27774 [Corynascus novoguineensis]|uniref:Uncharacterized protein n=1 Tax=Corynascus novoguineensis TaxID=1126955 RepID=A0AAN7D3G7_9PEZI|nr:hypothetical protein C7999DRAFT_27774 [Corynascus novoguineensis]
MPQTPPAFAFGRSGHGQHNDHRPIFSSPLSSSPIRPSSLSPPPQPRQQPLSPCQSNYLNTLPRQTQSSPIMGSGRQSLSSFISPGSENNQLNKNKFRFASRNPRPNPMLKRREDAQEDRRRLFFQNVRQRQEDKRWEMRGGEDELLKLEWLRFQREHIQAKEAEFSQYIGMVDADMAALEEEDMRMHEHAHQDVDELMADAIAQQEDAEIEAFLSALEGQASSSLASSSAQFSDDEDYDRLFMDLIQQQQQQAVEETGHSQDVEMS